MMGWGGLCGLGVSLWFELVAMEANVQCHFFNRDKICLPFDVINHLKGELWTSCFLTCYFIPERVIVVTKLHPALLSYVCCVGYCAKSIIIIIMIIIVIL